MYGMRTTSVASAEENAKFMRLREILQEINELIGDFDDLALPEMSRKHRARIEACRAEGKEWKAQLITQLSTYSVDKALAHQVMILEGMKHLIDSARAMYRMIAYTDDLECENDSDFDAEVYHFDPLEYSIYNYKDEDELRMLTRGIRVSEYVPKSDVPEVEAPVVKPVPVSSPAKPLAKVKKMSQSIQLTLTF